MNKIIKLLILTVLMTIFVGCGNESSEKTQEKIPADENVAAAKSGASNSSTPVNGDLTIKMLNVGQGDAILIQTKTQNILIDTSDTDEREKLRAELDKAGVKKIDKLILTHAHADHIGGAKLVIDSYNVKEVYKDGSERPKFSVYKSYISAANKKNIPVKTLQAGDKLNFGGKVSFEVFSPSEEIRQKFEAENDYNDTSIVGKLTYGDFSMLFTGDAEKAAENEILNTKYKKKLQSTILKAGHHGSKTSSGADFMKEVSPEYVLISAGEPDVDGGNTYGHPHKEALNSYIKAGVDKTHILWTYQNGTITITVTTDGKEYSVVTEKNTKWIDKQLKK